jgi:hypothetical protein
LNKDAGFELGKNAPATIQLLILCSNETTPKELAVQFDMDLNTTVNITLDNLYVYLNIPVMTIANT